MRDGHAGRAVRDPEWDAQRPSGERNGPSGTLRDQISTLKLDVPPLVSAIPTPYARRRGAIEHDVPRAGLVPMNAHGIESGEPPALRAARCRLNVVLLVLTTALLLAASAVNG